MTLKKWFMTLVIGLITLVAQAAAFDSQLEAETYDIQVTQYYQQGQFEQALPLAKKAFKIRMKALGEKHADTLKSMNNLAEIYRELGRFSEALSLSEKGYRLSQRVLRKKHLLSLAIINNLAGIYQELGRFSEALPLLKKGYRLSQEALGKKHQDTLLSLNNLAMIYKELGRLSDALPLFEKGYRLSQEVLGEKHPYTFGSRNNLALIYHELGRLSDALPLFEKNYRLSKKLLGEQHAQTLVNLNNLVGIYQALNHLSDALPLSEKSYRIFKKMRGEKHPSTLVRLDNLAGIYFSLGHLSKAFPLFEKNYHLSQEVLGKKHPHTIRRLNNLAEIYRELGHLSKALPLCEKSYRLSKEVLGEKHPKTISSLISLAAIYKALGRLPDALSWHEKSYLLSKKVLGEKHPKTLASFINLAGIYGKLGRFSETLPMAEKSYRLSQEVFGEKHSNTFSSRNNLAVIYQELGRLSEALPLYEKGYLLLKELLGEKHPSTLTSMNNRADIYQNLGRLSEALPLYEKCYRLSKEVLGEKHPLTIMSMTNLASTYQSKLGRLSEALPLSEKGYSLRKKLLGEQHPDTLISLNNLAYVYAEQGKTHKAIKHFEKYVEGVETLRSGNLSAENRQALFKQRVGGYFRLSELYISQYRYQDAFRVAEMSKARTLLESLVAKLAAQQSGLTAAEQRQLRDEEASLAFLNDRIAKALENNRLEEKITLETEKNQRVNQFNHFHRELMAKYPKYAQLSKVQIVGAKAGAKYLPADAVLISYLVNEDNENKNNVLAFTLQANGMLTAHYLGVIPDLEKTVKKYLRRLSLNRKKGMITQSQTKGRIILWPETKKDVVALSRELGKHLLEPLKDIIKDKRRWIISPSGPLALIPFETLRLEGEDSPVIDKHEITYVQSLSVLKLLQERGQAYQHIKKRGTLLAMGAPIYKEKMPLPKGGTSVAKNPSTADFNIARHLVLRGGDYARALRQLNLKWRNLPGALKELKQLKNLFFFKTHRLRIYKQAEATEANLQRLNKFGILAKYRYLVFSTHGYLSTEVPALSSIVLGQVNNPPGIDGYVTASEWAGYNLKSDLMVLSACETGVGEVISGEGVMGLPYAFYVAGNKNTLLTLWSISDKVTADFIFNFFRKLKMGIGQVEALTATKREFIEAGYGEAYWAAFVLYGV